MGFRLNVLEERKKQKCCGGNGPKCKCSSKTTPRQERKNSMIEFFETMSRNFLDKGNEKDIKQS